MSLTTKSLPFWFFFVFLLIAVSSLLVKAQAPIPSSVEENREPHLQNLKQLTFGGQNAEAYFSYDGAKIIFQSTRPPYQCDQIFSMNVDGSDVKLLNSGKGRTTCGFFFPDGRRIEARVTSGRFIPRMKSSAPMLTAPD